MLKIEIDGEAIVNLAGRKFKIKRQFLDDIESQSSDHIKKLNRALLILHSSLDDTVAIAETEKSTKKHSIPRASSAWPKQIIY